MFPGSEILFLIVGAILGVVLDRFWAWWSETTAEHEIWFSAQITPLRQKGPADALALLSRNVGDETVTNPSVLDLYVWSAGNRDLWKEAFDGSALELDFDVRVLKVLKLESSGADANAFSMTDDGTFVLQPGTVRKDFAVSYRLLVDGLPSLDVSTSPIDTEVLYLEHERERKVSRAIYAPGFVLGSLFVGVALLFFAMPVGIDDPESPFYSARLAAPYMAVIGALVTAVAIILLVQLSSGMSRRATRARQRLRQALGERSLLRVEKPDPFATDA